MIKKKIRVLVVDDQALVLDILTKGIQRDPDIEVVGTATDGQLALNQIPRVKPDVIILDMEMPRMNGLQFLQHLMPRNPIPTIVLSALTQSDSSLTQEVFEAGAVDFLSKPSGGARSLPNLLSQLWTKIKIAATQDVSQFKKAIKKDAALAPTALDRTKKVNQSILGMGALEVTNTPGKILKIFALGSCIGLALFCPDKNIVAMSHVVLPQSATDIEKAKALPGYFADTAIIAMLVKMKRLGCTGNVVAKIAGGAKTNVDLGDYFGVGQRNGVAVKANLLKKGIKIVGSEIGGTISRTVAVRVGDPNYYLQHPDKGKWVI